MFESRPFQKFFFVGAEEPTYQYASSSLVERRKDDVNVYHKHKNNKDPIRGGDGSLFYYLISTKWIGVWKKFVNGETSQPGPINNSVLAEQIMQRRKKCDYPLHDNRLGLKEPEDFY